MLFRSCVSCQICSRLPFFSLSLSLYDSLSLSLSLSLSHSAYILPSHLYSLSLLFPSRYSPWAVGKDATEHWGATITFLTSRSPVSNPTNSIMPCYTTTYYTTSYHIMSYHIVPYCHILCYVTRNYSILYYAILHYAILYYTILYYTILYHTIPYYTIP